MGWKRAERRHPGRDAQLLELHNRILLSESRARRSRFSKGTSWRKRLDSLRRAKWAGLYRTLPRCCWLCMAGFFSLVDYNTRQSPSPFYPNSKEGVTGGLVTLPSFQFAYVHILAQLPAAIKKEITGALTAGSSPLRCLRKQICLGKPEVRILQGRLRYPV